MRLRVLVIVVLPALVAALGVGVALAGGGQDEVAALRNATAKYHDIEVARAAGYITELPQTAAFGGGTCIANGAEGAMGIHLVDTRPVDEGGRLDGTLDPDAGAQTRAALARVDALLREAGTDKSRLLWAEVYLADMADLAAMNAAWDAWVDPAAQPARVTIQTPMTRPEWRVAIAVTALRPDPRPDP